MLSNLLEELSPSLTELLRRCVNSIILQTVITFVIPAILWRSLYFPLRNWFFPKSPAELPYWLPVLGHARQFITNSEALIARGRAYFGQCRAPFGLTLGGQQLYVVTSPDDVTAVYKNTQTLSWDTLLNDLLLGFGVSQEAIVRLWEKLPLEILQSTRDPTGQTQAPHLNSIHSMLDLYKRQLLPGPRSGNMLDNMTQRLQHLSSWSALCSMYNVDRQTRIQRVSLMQFCSSILVEAITRTLFGDIIYSIDPSTTQNLINFNEHAWMLNFKYPHGETSPLGVARTKLLSTFKRYLQKPNSMRQDQSWIIGATLEEQSHVDINDQDRAALLIMIYYGANINPYRLAFWILAYILFDAALLQEIRQETSASFQDEKLDIDHLLANSPILEATYHECLRLCNTSLSARRVSAPTSLGGRILRAGSTVVIPFRELHYDTQAFGEDAAQFRPRRFLQNPSLLNSKSYRPFGRGVSHCPGRYFAKWEMYLFLAIAISRLHIELSHGMRQEFPKYDGHTPAIGVNGPLNGVDLFVDLMRP